VKSVEINKNKQINKQRKDTETKV